MDREVTRPDGHLIIKERVNFGEVGLPMFASTRNEKFDNQALIKATIEEAYTKPNAVVKAKGDPVHLGIDSEYVQNGMEDGNKILCYSFCLIGKDFVLKGVIYSDIPPPKAACWTFERFIGYVLHEAWKQGVIDDWPKITYVYGHFLRADVTSFQSFWKYKKDVDSLGGTMASMRKGIGLQHDPKGSGRPVIKPIDLRKQSDHKVLSFVNFIDTQLLTPGRKGLDEVGAMLGLKKLVIPEPYCISRMDELLQGDKDFFEKYAIRDAEISVKYGLWVHEFTRETLGMKKLPLTIGSCAVSWFRSMFEDPKTFKKHENPDEYDAREYFNEIFGVKYVESRIWDGDKHKSRKRKRRVETVSRRFHAQFATDAFHGGRNECYVFGPTPVGRYYDIDLAGAYTTGLVDLLPLDYENCKCTKDPEKFRGHVMGLAHVTFEFPEGTRFPCLPVRTEMYGLQFPLSGESYCTAPEIEAALNMGADITITHGVIVPWKKDSTRVFQPFVEMVREKRSDPNLSKLAKAWVKEAGNSLYGKTAQSLKDKNVFDSHTLGSKPVRESMITNPYMAAHTTGLVRAVLAEVMNSVPEERIVVSATTDGFLTNATLDELNLKGPLATRYQELCNLITDNEPMLVCKHQCRQIIAMKTRGQLTGLPAKAGDEPEEDKRYPLAKTSVRPPRKKAGKALSKREQNEYMVKLFMDRYPKQKQEMRYLISMREQWLTESDLIEIKRFIKLNLEFDFKRKPVLASVQQRKMYKIWKNEAEGKRRDLEHVAFDTVPWESEEEMQHARSLFDGWRKGSKDDEVLDGNVLKTVQDFESWMDWYKTHLATEGVAGINATGGSLGVMKRVFWRALVRGKWGLNLDGDSKASVVHWLTQSGYPMTKDDSTEAEKERSRLPTHAVPVTKATIEFLKVVLKRYPDFDYQAVFVEEEDFALLVDE